MNHLEDFIDRAAKAGARFRQGFSAECVPICREKIVRSIESYVSLLRRCRIMKIASFKAGPTATYGLVTKAASSTPAAAEGLSGP